ncbi:hypothetical protein D3C80_1487590 [compost metagenome]
MGQTYGICSNFLNQCHVLVMLLRRNRPAHILAVLMSGDPMQPDLSAVQVQPLSRINAEITHAKRNDYLIYCIVIALQGYFGLIQMRIRNGIP